MDPVLTAPLLAVALQKVIDSMASETGKRAWDALMALISRTRRRDRQPEDDDTGELTPTMDNDPQLAERLLGLAATNSELASGLRVWLADVNRELPGSTSNTISGIVHGNAVQARDISGPITFN